MREINIAVASNRKKPFQNKKVTWDELVQKCRVTKRTDETMEQYLAMTKDRQSDIKDIGGFVGGFLTGGQRKKGTVEVRDVITLDADSGEENVWFNFIERFDCAAFAYSTHKHTNEKPRLRLVVLLDRGVSAEEYEPIARMIADRCGIDAFDDTTYQPERMMFWPSTSTDAPFFFKEQKGEPLSADSILQSYHNWKDCSSWPRSSRCDEIIMREKSELGDPREKEGVVGAFCRAYTIGKAIDKFLPDIYVRSKGGRYTNVNCSCAAGLVVYDDLIAHSFNSTDEISGKSVNAYDLVRIMKFGYQDGKRDHFTDVNRLPSSKSMMSLIENDEDVKLERILKKNGDAKTRDDDAWMGKLKMARNSSEPQNCQFNVRYILRHDPALKGKIYKNDLTNEAYYTSRLPWRDEDDVNGNWTSEDNSALREYLGIHYSQTNPQWIKDSFKTLLLNNTVHPVRDYLDKVTWDGIERLDTLFIDYFGAEDTELVRMQTRIEFTAAVARIYDPGTKFDNMIILAGEEGCGKSSFLQKIALKKEWFNDCLMGGLGTKEAIEAIRGRWIIEIGELAALKRNEVETVKNFLSRDEDKFRPAYAEQVERFPRQCVFFGTTNVVDCLRGTDGNRRMWLIKVKEFEPKKDIFTDLDKEIDQIWAEAKFRYQEGQQLFLDKRLEQMAREKQMRYNEMASDPRIGWIKEYLEKLLPDNWDEMNLTERKLYISNYPKSRLNAVGPFHHRDKVCIMEIQQECLEERLQQTDEFRPRDVGKLMKWIDGWEQNGDTHAKFPLYGYQRFFKFTGKWEDDDRMTETENEFGQSELPF